jgi:GNAT superfamily N-acetyltransferase
MCSRTAAVSNSQLRSRAAKEIIGFYDTSAKDFFGPLGVSSEHRKQGIGKVLLTQCLEAMEMEAYGYGIIPWVSSVDYYQKIHGA